MKREDLIKGLRQLADIYENKPFVDVPDMPTFWIWTYSAEDFVRNIAGFGNGAKKYTDEDIEFIPDVILPVKINCRRQNICTKRVVGTKRVAERVIPEYRVPEHDEDIVEWDCKPVLASAPTVHHVEMPLELDRGGE